MSNKLKVAELVKVNGFVKEELEKIAVVAGLQLTDAQYEKVEKAISEKVAERFNNSVHEALLNDDSIEFQHMFNIAATKSTVRTNEDGSPVRKISVKTRTALKNELNN